MSARQRLSARLPVLDWLGEVPPRDPETPALSGQLDDAARTLADRITAGEIAASDNDDRIELRRLALTMARWSEEARDLEMALSDAQLREAGWLPRPGRLARLIRRLGLA